MIQSRIQKKRKNHKCPAVNVCHVGALSQKDFEAPKIDYDKCIKCGKCSNFCPKKALVLDKKMQCIKYEQNNNLFSCLQFLYNSIILIKGGVLNERKCKIFKMSNM